MGDFEGARQAFSRSIEIFPKNQTAQQKLTQLNLKGSKDDYFYKSGPLFSVLVPTYNQAQYLGLALDSLLAQQYPRWEAVVVNDGSTDGTAAVMERYATQDARIRCFHKANGGVSTALNEGLRQAKGSWICWLSSDDLFEPDALFTFAHAIRQNPQSRFFHSHFYELHESDGRKTAPFPDRVKTIPARTLQTQTFFQFNYVHGISIAAHRSVFEKVGQFDESYPNAQDVNMWQRISAYYQLHFINHRTCVTRIHDTMGTQAFPEAGFFDIARSCIEFLNTHPFEKVFPWYNWHTAKDVGAIIEYSLRVGVEPRALMYQGIGFVPALLEKLGEWYTHSCPPLYKKHLAPTLQAVVQSLSADAVPQPLIQVVAQMAANQPIVYTPRNPYDLFVQHRAELEAQGLFFQANTVQRYIDKLNKHLAKLQSPAAAPAGAVDPDLKLAQEYMAESKPQQAVSHLIRAVEAGPNSIVAAKLLAHAYLLAGQKHKLPELYQSWVKSNAAFSKQDKAWFENILPRETIR